MKNHPFKVFLVSFFLALSYGSAVLADDTDIYLGDPDASPIRPNILFVLDTSDSMNREVTGTGKSRLENMQEAMIQLVQDLDNVNIGLMRFNGRRHGDNATPTGGAVVFPLANLDDNLSVIPSEADPASQSIAVQLTDSNDDGTETVGTGTMNLSSNVLEVSQSSLTEITASFQINADSDDARANLAAGDTSLDRVQVKRGNFAMALRFRGINIDPDATITAASVRFVAKNTDGGTVSATIAGEANATPAAFSAGENLTARAITAATVAWIPPKFFRETGYSTVDISPVITELTQGATGWVNGGDMVLFVYDDAGSSTKSRSVYDFSNNPAKAAILDITYLGVAAGTSTQDVGIRFQAVGIPQGAIITSAEIDFLSSNPVANSAGEDVVEVQIEDADDAASYSTAINDISSRTYLSDADNWTIADDADLVLNDVVTVPGLAGLVQQVVDRGGWCGGNAMAFRITLPAGNTAGTKVFKSSDAPFDDDNPAGAPILRVVYDQSGLTGDQGCVRKTLTFQGEHSKDDGYEVIDTSAVELSGRLKTGTTDSTGGSNTVLGLRFPGISLLSDTEVISAQLEVMTKKAGTGATNLLVRGLDKGNMPRLESDELLSDTSLKPRTTAQVDWAISDDSAIDETLVSPDISSIIREVIQDASNNWILGSALGLFLENGDNSRSFYSYNNNPALAPRLKIVIEANASDSITVRDRILQLINEQNHTLNRTPSIESLYEAALYWRGDDVYYGTHRGQGNFPNGIDNPNDTDPFHHNDGDKDGNPVFDPTGMRHGRVSHPDSYTGGTLVQSAGCSSTNLDATECFDEVINDSPTYVSPFGIAECQSNFMIFLSDGAPTENNEAPGLIKDLTGVAECSTNIKGDNGACGIDILEYLNTEDQSDLTGAQTVTTYTIGFNIGDADSANTVVFMQELAAAGGGEFKTADTANELSEQLLDIFSDIFSQPTSFAAPALQVNAFNKLQHRNDVYFSLFTPAKETRWNGNIKKYEVCDGTDVGADACTLGEIIDSLGESAINTDGVIDVDSHSFWSIAADGPVITNGGAGAVVPDHSLRKIYTYTGAASPDSVDLGLPEHLLHTDNIGNLDTLLGFADGSVDSGLTSLINWIRGADAYDDEDEDGDTNDNRWQLTDPLHGSPVALTYGCVDGVSGTPCTDTGDNAIIKVFVTGNDGSVHMLNGNNGDTYGGVEEWAFYPQAMLADQAALAVNAEGDHHYGVDNTPTVIQLDLNGDAMVDPSDGEYIRLFFSMRRGGDSIFALDVTPDSGVLTVIDEVDQITPTLLWRIEGGGGDFPNLGQTWSRPKPATVKVPSSGGGAADSEFKTVLIFGGGYDTAQDDGFGKSNLGNAIYIVDADTGERLWWASNGEILDSDGASPNLILAEMDYPIPSDIALVDSSGDGAIDRLYVGDMGGQVWRIDLDAQLGKTSGAVEDQDQSSGARLAVLSNPDADGSLIEDHRKFFYPPDVIQVEDAIFSEEASYDLVAIVSGDRANPLEEDVLNRAYGLRDYAVTGALVEDEDGSMVPLRHSGYDIGDGTVDGDADGDSEFDLFDTTENLIQVGSDGVGGEQELAQSAMKASGGWFIDLVDDSGSKAGEKGLSAPIILAGKLFFTTFLPSEISDPCQVIVGSGRLYGINAISAQAEFEDWLEGGDDASFETGDRTYSLGGGIPSSAVPIFQDKGVTLLIGTGGGAESVDPDISLPRVRTYWYQE